MKSHTISGKIVLVALLAIILCFAGGSTAWAKIPNGSDCLDCHDMHGSFGMKTEYAGEVGCINCHSSSESSTYYTLNPEDAPFGDGCVDGNNCPEIIVPVTVYTGANAPTEFLASGNFWWVKGPADGIPGSPYNWTGGGQDIAGHNIFPGEPDDRWSYAPGNANGCQIPGSCHVDLYTVNYLYGTRQSCLKCHMMTGDPAPGYIYPTGFHHAEDECTERYPKDHPQEYQCVPGTEIYVVGANVQVPDDPDFDGFYRFLDGHMAGAGHGVAGIEDPDWEATVSSIDHNEYLGDQVDLNAATGFGGANPSAHTTTAYCVGCHGNFHISSDYATGKPDDEIVDNPDAVYVGTWPVATGPECYGPNYQWQASGIGGNTATWTPDLPESNTYNVYAWWSADANRATNATYTIVDCGTPCHSPDPVQVDQRTNGGQWNLIGTFDFMIMLMGWSLLMP
jgi:hypothetical protein